MERTGAITFKGGPLTLQGAEVKVGQAAPDFKALTGDLACKALVDYRGKVKLFAAVPSLDTPVCDLEIRRFNEEAAKLSKDVAVICVSADLPFAQKRFCQAAGIAGVETLSDHREMSFGNAYGASIKELRLLTRAVFIVDRSDRVVYVEYVKEITTPPDYAAALAALKKAV